MPDLIWEKVGKQPLYIQGSDNHLRVEPARAGQTSLQERVSQHKSKEEMMATGGASSTLQQVMKDDAVDDAVEPLHRFFSNVAAYLRGVTTA